MHIMHIGIVIIVTLYTLFDFLACSCPEYNLFDTISSYIVLGFLFFGRGFSSPNLH